MPTCGCALTLWCAIGYLMEYVLGCAGLSQGVLHSSGHGLGQHGQPASAEAGHPASSPMASAFGELSWHDDQNFKELEEQMLIPAYFTCSC